MSFARHFQLIKTYGFFQLPFLYCFTHHLCKNKNKMTFLFCLSSFVPINIYSSPSVTQGKGSSWSWSYGSLIYSYICNQCLLPLTLWVRTSLRQGVLDTTLCDKFVSDLWQVGGFLWILWFPPPIKLIVTL